MSERKMYCFAVKVRLEDLPTATALMNESSEWFQSRVSSVTILPDKTTALVVVEHTNDYPYMTDRWRQYCI